MIRGETDWSLRSHDCTQDAADAVHVLVEAQPWSLNCRDTRGRSAAHWAAVRGATEALEALVARGADVRSRDADSKSAGELLPTMTRPPVLRQWEAERKGAADEYRWDYAAVMEATMFRHDLGRRLYARGRLTRAHPRCRYMKKACAARRSRSGATERQCGACKVRCAEAAHARLCAVADAAPAAIFVRCAALQRLPRGVLLRLGLPTPRLDVGRPPPGVRGGAAAAGAPHRPRRAGRDGGGSVVTAGPEFLRSQPRGLDAEDFSELSDIQL